MLVNLRKAQSTAEYAILISVIVGAALAMQVYIKRSLQAKMHDAGVALSSVSGDITGSGAVLGTSKQYEPYYSEQRTSGINRATTSTSGSDTLDGGAVARDSVQDVAVTSTATEQTHVSTIEE
ncbi:MAG: hypothetical protein ABIE75_02190 [Candidatus Omnitrophota bacterium]